MTINHELCSELLGPFLRGELGDERRREVEAHIASCEGCGEELRAFEALGGPEVEPLSELESARLHRDVWANVASLPRPERKSLGARLVPYLGTAAVLALFAVGAVTLSGEGADERARDTAQVESLDTLADQDSAGTDSTGAGAAEEGTRTTVESPLTNEGAANDSAELEAGTEPGTAAGDETLSAESESATFDFSAKQSFLLGCAIGVGAP